MKNQYKILAVFVLGLAVGLSGCSLPGAQKSSTNTTGAATAQGNVNPLNITPTTNDQYQQSVVSILAVFKNKNIKAALPSSGADHTVAYLAAQRALASKAKDDLMALTVPPDFQTLHLQLVVGLDELLTALDLETQALTETTTASASEAAAQKKFLEGYQKVQSTIDTTSWLLQNFLNQPST